MKFIELKNNLGEFIIFTLNDIRKIEPGFHSQRFFEWKRKGYIKKIVNGYYIFSDQDIGEAVLFYFANKLYDPSYISLETALSYYNLIPEGVYNLSSVSTRRTYELNGTIGRYYYRKLKPEMFFGYKLIKFNSHVFKIAEPEKAVIDYFYLNSRIDTEETLNELRINSEIFRQLINIQRIQDYLIVLNNKKLNSRILKLLKFINDASY